MVVLRPDNSAAKLEATARGVKLLQNGLGGATATIEESW